jgi:hypothetical protein
MKFSARTKQCCTHAMSCTPQSSARSRTVGRPDSDVDILVEIDSKKHIGLFGYAGIELDLSDRAIR